MSLPTEVADSPPRELTPPPAFDEALSCSPTEADAAAVDDDAAPPSQRAKPAVDSA
eukprot:CAMPEP_0119485388 /NCGR_PEP_ID=MMETSP1344-20130328/12114_1 /TAXON_ID=236787 /ORGANISM="Florenciella parvula, Strain CCMP2471" /LENGTH=55 /DNA_ID=CAMNT_0007520061 /DNA_START=103 /DNA_END=266 /DNA_ORIENTATION=+